MLPSIHLGPTGVELRPLGLGAWAWGDKRVWQFDPVTGPSDAREAWQATLDAGITLVDTAEMYGSGKSEEIVGQLQKESGRPVFIATKFAPLPYRVSSAELPKALYRSLARLQLETVDLYQVHWPWSLLRISALMDRMADAVEAGQVRYVGVSNYNEGQMRRAHAALARRGVPLVSNQVHYNLLTRGPESNGVLAACRELNVTLIAYSPLAQGALTGKYRPETARAGGIRRWRGPFRNLDKVMPVVETLEKVGREHGRTAGQVALNWLARQDHVLPIPGAKNGRQAAENAGSIDFDITEAEAAEIERVSRHWK